VVLTFLIRLHIYEEMADTVTVPHTPRKINMAPALKVVVEDTWDTEVQKLKGNGEKSRPSETKA